MRLSPFLPLAPFLIPAAAAAEQERAAERERMVLAAVNLAVTSGALGGRAVRPAVLDAMRRVPRHLFVPDAQRVAAYREQPLPIGHGATISAPAIVALMTELLDVRPEHRVLEVGTGSGYQAAILAVLAGEVLSIEIVEPLARSAAERLEALGYSNVAVRLGDGYLGWPEQAPFDRIIVTAAAPDVPQTLVAQLAPGGRMVIPVGRGEDERLMLITKDARGRVSRRAILPVRFVPLVRGTR
ncbi:MAG TPA: protein-L-isoaspartate(D-aspartate) O-methyltransferase [Allosphingosinicella sp.]|nr:protein-L-isoaspartate(D-aspartate) O-methyltransferase [Allosphingosinicella sp.]